MSSFWHPVRCDHHGGWQPHGHLAERRDREMWYRSTLENPPKCQKVEGNLKGSECYLSRQPSILHTGETSHLADKLLAAGGLPQRPSSGCVYIGRQPSHWVPFHSLPTSIFTFASFSSRIAAITTT